MLTCGNVAIGRSPRLGGQGLLGDWGTGGPGPVLGDGGRQVISILKINYYY